MWAPIAITVFGPIYVIIAWAIYFATKWIAGFMTRSALDQSIMGLIATVIIIGVAVSAII